MIQELKLKLSQMEKKNALLEEMLIGLQSTINSKDEQIKALQNAAPAAAQVQPKAPKVEGVSTDTQSNSSIFDIESILRLKDTETKYKDIIFEIEKLKMDNSELQDGYNLEKKTAAVYAKLYNR